MGQPQRQLPPSKLSLCFQGIKCAQGPSWSDGALPDVCYLLQDLLVLTARGAQDSGWSTFGAVCSPSPGPR